MNLNSPNWNLLERTLIDYRLQRKFRKPSCGPKQSKSPPVCSKVHSLCAGHCWLHPSPGWLLTHCYTSHSTFNCTRGLSAQLQPQWKSWSDSHIYVSLSLKSEYRTCIFPSGLHQLLGDWGRGKGIYKLPLWVLPWSGCQDCLGSQETKLRLVSGKDTLYTDICKIR